MVNKSGYVFINHCKYRLFFLTYSFKIENVVVVVLIQKAPCRKVQSNAKTNASILFEEVRLFRTSHLKSRRFNENILHFCRFSLCHLRSG